MKKTNKYHVVLTLTEYAGGERESAMIKDRTHPLFEELSTAFPAFMKKLKSS